MNTPKKSNSVQVNLQSAMVNVQSTEPLAKRMAPRTLEEFVGQEHVLGAGQLLRRAIEADRLGSMILYGPPGSGKNAMANVIALRTQAYVERVNAVLIGVADIRKVIEQAKDRRQMRTPGSLFQAGPEPAEGFGQRTILFLDEIHRFNKLQQDALLPDVESGVITLIGATTHNPYFYVNQALLSRSLVVEFRPLSSSALEALVRRALGDSDRGLGGYRVEMDPEALKHLVDTAEGDARTLLNALEVGVVTTPPDAGGVIQFTLEIAEASLQRRKVRYDGDEDEHYDTISAFIKSMRGGDPDAALYWMAKMIKAGEDPRFIARRIVICAAEDVGNADPQALVVANAALQVSEFVGWPEARIPLAQAAVYLACAPKSNAAYLGINRALEDVDQKPLWEVPNHLKDASRDAKSLGHGSGYKYPHDYPGHHVDQAYLPEPRRYYEPTDLGAERDIQRRLEAWRSKKPS